MTAQKYKAYPEYRDSEVEWLGEIPFTWKICTLKHLAQIKNGRDYKSVESEKGYPVIGSGGPFTYASTFMFDKESVLLGRKGTIDKPLYINEPFWTVDTMYYTEIEPEASGRFVYYLSTTIQFAKFATNTALPSMTQEHLGNCVFATPDNITEQIQIARFLDHETGKIDLLIEKQQELIALLREKRQAVISHAVTKGLNPQAPLKDSGIEWLGQVPEHWEIVPLKFLVNAPIIDGPHVSPTRRDVGVPFISAEAVGKGYIDFDKKWGYISEADNKIFSKRYSPEVGDILVIKLGATTGISAIVEDETDFNVWVPLATVRVTKKVNPYLIFYALQSHQLRDAIELNWTYGTQQTLGLGTLANFRFPIPPEHEVDEIVQQLKKDLPRFDKIIDQAEAQITLLQERRTALVSAAVTGKIDVRDWQPPENAAVL